ncbi:MAG: class II aldolase/adducin family protein [Chloroflexi bacterium]|nr:class II aldolase/adducin family protein [Chloroflexota bacterium]
MPTIPEQIVIVARRLFERRLLDMSGGNLSSRCGDEICITPRYSGSRKHWQLEPEDIIQGRLDSAELMENPMLSREAKAHLAIYRNFPAAGAVVHAHALHVLPFCALSKPIEPVLEATQKFGVVECIAAAPAHSSALADNVVTGLQGKEDRMLTQAAAVLIPKHGLIVAGKDLLAAVDAVERIDWNAYCILAMKILD